MWSFSIDGMIEERKKVTTWAHGMAGYLGPVEIDHLYSHVMKPRALGIGHHRSYPDCRSKCVISGQDVTKNFSFRLGPIIDLFQSLLKIYLFFLT